MEPERIGIERKLTDRTLVASDEGGFAGADAAEKENELAVFGGKAARKGSIETASRVAGLVERFGALINQEAWYRVPDDEV